MSFKDIFNSRFLEQVTAFSLTDMLISLLLSFALGLFVFEIYKRTFKGVMYSRSFGITLVALAMITDLAILTVTSNVVLSLGMVGALSIVRFRTAIKDPIDIAYLFWSIVIGIMLGAGMLPLAVFGSVFVGIIFVFLAGKDDKDTPYILVLMCQNETAETEALKRISESVKRCLTKSKTVTHSGIELTIEIRLNEDSTAFVNDLLNIEGIDHASLVSYL